MRCKENQKVKNKANVCKSPGKCQFSSAETCGSSSIEWKEEYELLKKTYSMEDEQYNCVDRTMKRKLEKSSLVHVYFKSLGVTRFTKDTLFAWQDLVCEC